MKQALLFLAVVVAVCAPSSAAEKAVAKLRAGASAVDITPKEFPVAMLNELQKPAAKNAPSVTLIRGGHPVAAIVLAPDAPPAAQLAAYELQWHLRQITGAALPIVRDDPRPAGTAILVGESAATRARGLRSAEFAPQEYLVRIRPPDSIVLIGRDSPGTQKVDYARRETFPDRFSDTGTLYAVYDFLERTCGVRWYLPTELGIACPQAPTLKVGACEVRRQPFMRYRDLPTAYSITNDLCGETVKRAWPKERKPLDYREQMLWAFRQRLGGQPYHANHSLMWPEEYAAHPDWFAKGYDEEMKQNPANFLKNKAGQPVPPQLCYSNPAVLEFVVRQARDYFDGKLSSIHGLGDCVALVPADGGRFCRCDACRKLHCDETATGTGQWLSGRDSEYVWGFINRVARELRKTHPTKTIGALAYEDYAAVPTSDIEPNIVPMFTLNIRLAHDPLQEAHEWTLLDAWQKKMNGRPFYVWLYYNFPVDNAVWGDYRCFPGFAAHATARYVKKLAAGGVRGIFIEPGVYNEWSRDVLFGQLDEYATWKLADDPALDADRLIREFFDRFCGAAAVPMRDLYTRIESIYGNPATYTQGDVLVFDILDRTGGGTPPVSPARLSAVGFRVAQLTDPKWQDRITQVTNLRVSRITQEREAGVLRDEAFAGPWPGNWTTSPDFRIARDGGRTVLELPWNAQGGTVLSGLRAAPRPGDGLRLTWDHRAAGYDFYRPWQFVLATTATPDALTGYAVSYERDGWNGKPYMDILKLDTAAPDKPKGTVFKLYGNAKTAGGWSPCPLKDEPATSLNRSQACTAGAWTRFRLDVRPEKDGTRLRLYMRNADTAPSRPVGHQTEEVAWGLLGTRDRMAELAKLMQSAKAAARTDWEKRRVELFDRGVWQYMLRGKAAYGGDRECIR